MKKTLVVVISLAMLISMMAGIDFTAFSLPSSGKLGSNITYKFDDKEGTLTISGEGNIPDYQTSESDETDTSDTDTTDDEEDTSSYDDEEDTSASDDEDDSSEDDSDYSDEFSPFYGKKEIKKVVIESGITGIGSGVFESCKGITSVTVPSTVEYIGEYSFAYDAALTSVTIGSGLSSVRYAAFYECTGLKDVNYDGSKEQWDKITIDADNDYLKNANIHFSTVSVDDIYNLGDETYSFENYIDDDSWGHCFGMSMTSSGYYLGLLNRSIIGGDTSESLYSFELSDTVKAPICKYQEIQGSYSNFAIVAGGSSYLTGHSNIDSDWNAAVNYVKDHDYDNKGSLQVGFRKNGQGGHAVNFLYYDEVSGQQRIYIYDNNFPDVESYLYRDSSGNVYEEPESTFSGSIDCVALRDVSKYYSKAGTYDKTRCVYAENGTIKINGDNVVETPMESETDSKDYTMFELPENAETATIVPQKDNASFTYMDSSYSFAKISDNTYGVLKLAKSEDESKSEEKQEFSVVNAPAETPTAPAAPTAPQTKTTTTAPATTQPETTTAAVSKPKATKIKKLKKGKKSFTVQWKKVKNVSGYQIQYSTNKKMKKAKTKNVKGAKKTKVTVKKLKKGKKYYVRIRTYKTVGGKKVYSKWSAKKTVKTK